MESELIIDGQVIDLSEKQGSAEEVTTEQQEQSEKKDQAETRKRLLPKVNRPKSSRMNTPCASVTKKSN